MQDGNDRLLEAAEAFYDRRRDQEIGRIRGALSQEGDDFCRDCGDDIGEARKAALPSATRCVGCQQAFEREQGLRRPSAPLREADR